MAKRRVILDCDPGHDDLFCIFLAAMNENCELLGITSVGGNQTIDKVTKNILNALNILQLDIPVARGCGPSLIPLETKVDACEEIHGESGLDTKDKSFVWPSHTRQVVEDKAAVFIAKTVMESPEPVHIVATGKLTNIALLLTLYPEALHNIAQISIMGGAVREIGNMHPVSEFNIWLDPEAAHIVFNHGCSPDELKLLMVDGVPHPAAVPHKVPILLAPLDITHTVLVTDDVITRVGKACQWVSPTTGNQEISPFGRLCVDLLTFFSESYRDYFGFTNGGPLHDPVAMFAVLYPEHCTFLHQAMEVDMTHGPCRGKTVVDFWNMKKQQPNVLTISSIQLQTFWDIMMTSLQKANQCSILSINEKQ